MVLTANVEEGPKTVFLIFSIRLDNSSGEYSTVSKVPAFEVVSGFTRTFHPGGNHIGQIGLNAHRTNEWNNPAKPNWFLISRKARASLYTTVNAPIRRHLNNFDGLVDRSFNFVCSCIGHRLDPYGKITAQADFTNIDSIGF
jgi:hypothetical protein